VTSRQLLLLLLLLFSADFALPFEPGARGWAAAADEEESVRSEARRPERPRAGTPTATDRPVIAARPRPASAAVPRPRLRRPEPARRLARTDASSPPAAPDAH
jgi:hypothetical protein